MLTRRVIPCLDVHDGQVTRGQQFGVAEKGGLRNVGDPVELALRYNEQGADEMVFFVNAGPKVRRRAGEKCGAWLRFRFSGIGGQEFTPPGTSGWAPALPKPERSGGAGGGRAGAARHRGGVAEHSSPGPSLR